MKPGAAPNSTRAAAVALALLPAVASAQPEAQTTAPTLRISLAEAVEVAVVRNYALNRSRLNVKNADQQVREAYSELYPSLDGTASYQRQFDALNPFAGSSAADLFTNQGAASDFLLENERRQQAGEPQLSYTEYLQLRREAQEEAGLVFDPDENPFFIDNRFRFELTVTQLIYDGAAFSGLKAASRLKEAERASFEEQARQVVLEVATRYYAALLAQARAEITGRREQRARAEVAELSQRVERGTRPRFDLLSVEVDLANAEAARLRAENDAADERDRLKLVLGLPHDQPIALSDELIAPDASFSPPASVEAALSDALETRPDLRAASLRVELNEIEASVTFAGYLPVVEAFFTAAVIGQVPDNRDIVTQPDPLEPTTVTEERGFFSDEFWGPDILGGINLRWNFFNGFQTTSRLAQNRIATRQARLNLQELQTRVQIEVTRSLRTLRSAWQQLESQNRNVDKAELNYRHAAIRVDEGVAGTVELRQANEQLDESRLNYLQSLHDYRLAEVQYDVSVGRPPYVRLDELGTDVREED